MNLKSIDRPLTVLGLLHSPFKKKFGLPRQGLLTPSLRGKVELFEPYCRPEWWRDLKGISHLWLISWLHDQKMDKVQALVRPPRLGGNKKVSTFAARSPIRPNPLGLTLVALTSIEENDQGIFLHIRGHDLLDQTPIIDLKPYSAEGDSPRTEVTRGWIDQQEHQIYDVSWSEQALLQARTFFSETQECEDFFSTINELLRYDIRPRYKLEKKEFIFEYDSLDIVVQLLDHRPQRFEVRELKTKL